MMGTTRCEDAALKLSRRLAGLGIQNEVNGDSAGYEVFVPLPDAFVLSVTAAPAGLGYDWQLLDSNRQQVLCGTWIDTDAEEAAQLVHSLVNGLGSNITR